MKSGKIKRISLLLAVSACLFLGANSANADTAIEETAASPNTTTSAKITTSESETTTQFEEESTTSGEIETTTQFEEETTVEPSNEPAKKILFIGNSSTYYNDMPDMVEGLARAAGRNVDIQSITAPNYKLYQFASEGSVYYTQIVNTLSSNRFDYVVVQDHRDVIIQTPAQTEDAISKLLPFITASGAELVLYETQADYAGKNFIIDNCSFFLGHTEMQYYMTKNYFSVANNLNASIVPAGVNYTRCRKIYPEINLYAADMHHPSPAGSYLAACSLYATLFDTTSFDNDFLPNSAYDTDKLLSKISVDDAKKIQSIADATLILDKKSIELRKGQTSSVNATFTFTEGNPSLSTFANTIEYFSLNDSVISTNRDTGLITALAVGNTAVMATTDSGLMAMCSVVVKQSSTSFTITDAASIKVHKNDTFTYNYTLLPADTTDKITWKSSDTSVATVDENGTVIAKKVGVAKITAITDSGIKVTRKVKVRLATPTKVKVKKLNTKTKGKKYSNLRITWGKNKNAVKYYVYRSTKKSSGYKKIATTTKVRYTDKNKLKGKTYYYKIKAIYSKTSCNSLRSTATKFKVPKK